MRCLFFVKGYIFHYIIRLSLVPAALFVWRFTAVLDRDMAFFSAKKKKSRSNAVAQDNDMIR